VNILPLGEDERITAMLPVHAYSENAFVFMATSNGTVKKTPLLDFSRPRSSGLIAIELEDGNTLVGAAVTDGESEVMLFQSGGRAIRFKERDVRAMGRTARGVRGIKLPAGTSVISLIIADPNGVILLASQNGYGKLTEISEFSTIGRGGQGVIAIKVSDRNGALVGAEQVTAADEVLLISDQGTMVRTRVQEVSLQGRNTQGVRLINVGADEHLVGMARIEDPVDPAGEAAADHEAASAAGLEASSDGVDEGEAGTETT
jgi:DNA gyrase subunit A